MTKNQANNSEQVRLNRYLAMAGLGSRRTCDEIITAGRVKVNGNVVTQMGVRINPEKDVVECDGKIVKQTEPKIYILLNKPLKTVTTVKDDRKRKTVIDVVGLPHRIFPVGRLDYYTTGVLLLTNDGDLSYHLIHPKFGVPKVYRVLLDKIIRPIDLHHFQHGIEIDGKKTAPCKARELRRINNCSYLVVELHEGRNRQIRRMFEALGYHVEELERISFAGIELGDLKPGEWRELTGEEVKRLKQMVESFKKNRLKK